MNSLLDSWDNFPQSCSNRNQAHEHHTFHVPITKPLKTPPLGGGEPLFNSKYDFIKEKKITHNAQVSSVQCKSRKTTQYACTLQFRESHNDTVCSLPRQIGKVFGNTHWTDGVHHRHRYAININPRGPIQEKPRLLSKVSHLLPG